MLFPAEIGAILVAEAVETAFELEVLEHLGVQYAQGYHLAGPVRCRTRCTGPHSANVSPPR